MDWIEASKAHQEKVDQLVLLLLEGHRRTLAQCISMVESSSLEQRQFGLQVLEIAKQQTDQCAIRIGFSGAAGAGKSTLINCLGREIVESGYSLAVLTVDPSSARKGGSLLGDAIRMDAIASREDVFIRSTPSGQNTGGIAKATASSIELCEVAGYDAVLVESLGSGQVEFELAHTVDLYYWLTTPGAGDDLQAMKQGVLEWVDGIIITQADRGREHLALESKHAYEQGLHLYGYDADVVAISSHNAEHIEALWQSLMKSHEALVDFNFLSARQDKAGQERADQGRRAQDRFVQKSAKLAIQDLRAGRARRLNDAPLYASDMFYFEEFDQFIEQLRFQFFSDDRDLEDFLPKLIKVFDLDGAEICWNGISSQSGAQLTVAERCRLSFSLPVDLMCQSNEREYWSGGERQLPLLSVMFIPLSVTGGGTKRSKFETISNPEFQFLIGYRFLETDSRASVGRMSRPSVITTQWARALQGLFFELGLQALHQVVQLKIGGVDSLTGIANRATFHDHLQQILIAYRAQSLTIEPRLLPKNLYVFAIDLDDFSQINEVLGLDEGDKLLQIVAQALSEQLNPEDVLARFGSDEFFICKTLHSEETVVDFGLAIRQALELAVNSADTAVLRLNCHIGCVRLTDIATKASEQNKNSCDTNEILRAAGAALLTAKSMGLHTVFMYDVQLKKQAKEIYIIKHELFQALEDEQFFYLAQPLFDHKSKLIVGAELLLRWNHPSRGVLAASEFIESADGLGIVQENDLRLIFKHLDEIVNIAKKYNVVFHLNLSAQLFFSQDIIKFAIALEKKGALPYLHFEITERAFIDQMILLHEFIAKVKAGGSRVWLDDFGIGYSGMRYLDELNIDGVKIDQSFIRRIHQARTRTLFRGITNLMLDLKLWVLAEGVEHQSQAELLSFLGCQYQQGLFHGNALSLDAFAALLEKQPKPGPGQQSSKGFT